MSPAQLLKLTLPGRNVSLMLTVAHPLAVQGAAASGRSRVIGWLGREDGGGLGRKQPAVNT